MHLDEVVSKHPPLYARVRDVLRRAILGGRLRPGQRLNETQIAEQLGVSRTPLREALRHLEAEGLVEPDGQGGMVVTRLDVNDIASMYECRIALERLSAASAARHATQEDVKQLRAMLDEARAIVRRGDMPGLLNHNVAFHRLIAVTGRNSWVLRLLEQLWGHMLLFRANVLGPPGEEGTVMKVLAEHEYIVDCIAKRDGSGAADAMEAHLRRDLDRGRRALETSGTASSHLGEGKKDDEGSA